MTQIFNRGRLPDFLHQNMQEAVAWVARLPEDEVLSRSVGDLVAEALEMAWFEPVSIGADPVDGGVELITVEQPDAWGNGRPTHLKATRVRAVWTFTGGRELFGYQATTHTMSRFEATVGSDTIELSLEFLERDPDPSLVRAALAGEMDRFRKEIGYANADASTHNTQVAGTLTAAVERRKTEVQGRRGLAGALGFPLTKQPDAPRPVPLNRKVLALRPQTGGSAPFTAEPELLDAQFNEALGVVASTLLAMERTPSVASGAREEELRDQILVQLNGTFQNGGATGETFLTKGKTDILLSDGERHVLVAECKWWDGPVACDAAIDQLLGYLTWRNVKAALLFFVDRKDATAVIAKADETVRAHGSHKRPGPASPAPDRRLNYVLGHHDDPAREIQLAVLFAVLPKG